MNHPSYRALIFDLDGTLLDSFTAHFTAYRAMLAHYDIHVTLDDLLACYSPNWLEVYRAVGLPETVWEEADEIWLAENARQTPELFPGAADLLARLRVRVPLGLVTSGSKERVWNDLRRTGIQQAFDVVVTGDDIARPKPASDGILAALESLKVAPAEALYIGDTAVDFQTASAAGVAFAGIANRLLDGAPADEYLRLEALAELERMV